MTTIERDWTTAAGLRAVCLMVSMGHRCGYVEVPVGHPLHGAGYSEPHPAIQFDESTIEIGKKSPILALTASVRAAEGETIRRSPDVAFDVHGGLTWSGSGKYPVESDGWWFGFDCAHSGDRTRTSPFGVERTEEYVVSECEDLARQIVEMVEVPA